MVTGETTELLSTPAELPQKEEARLSWGLGFRLRQDAVTALHLGPQTLNHRPCEESALHKFVLQQRWLLCTIPQGKKGEISASPLQSYPALTIRTATWGSH